jgi:hypothetical protein
MPLYAYEEHNNNLRNIFFIEIPKISSFISCSEKANIMIHEATFSDDLQENAI